MRQALGPAARFLEAEDGPTTVEYAVMLALLLGAIFLTVTAMGDRASEWWKRDSDTIIEATQSVLNS
jgi:Flp pilus assembly pilin Flp